MDQWNGQQRAFAIKMFYDFFNFCWVFQNFPFFLCLPVYNYWLILLNMIYTHKFHIVAPHFPCKCLIHEVYSHLIAQFVLMLPHVSVTNCSCLQGATCVEDIQNVLYYVSNIKGKNIYTYYCNYINRYIH